MVPRLISSLADVTLLVDRDGQILEVTLGDAVEAQPGWKKLVGMRWAETVGAESRGKVEQLLAESRDGKACRAREINQTVEGLADVPLRFSAVVLDGSDHVLALGRDLRPLAKLQQQVTTTQQALDREHGRKREADTRYRVLFHVALEGALIVDARTRRVLEANPSAASMLGDPSVALQGKGLQDLFEARSWPAVQALLAEVDAGARHSEVQVRLQGQKDEMVLAATLFQQAGSALVLLRFWPASAANNPQSPRASRILAAVDSMPDGFVVTGSDRRILSANAAFCELVEQANEKQLLGEPLDRWLGRPGVDVNIVFANVRDHGAVRNFATIIRSDYGPVQEALVTAVAASDGKTPCVGLAIRTVSSRLASAPAAMALPRSLEQIRELVGRVPLKDLVREASDMIERLCIEAALQVSGNNRVSTAQLLGLSRQGLYLKLRRHGIAEFGSE
jgi:transcriptional regulator PpsR